MVLPLNPYWKVSRETRHQAEDCSICLEPCSSSDKRVVICAHEVLAGSSTKTLSHPHHLECLLKQLDSDVVKFLLSPDRLSHTMPCPVCRESLFSRSILSIDHPLAKSLTESIQKITALGKQGIATAILLEKLFRSSRGSP